MTFFTIFRTQSPKVLKYHFGVVPRNNENPNDDPRPEPISDDQTSEIFEGEDVVQENVPPNLKLLNDIA